MNYFLVSQRNQAAENNQKKLTAPDDKSHSYIKDYARQGDLIVQYNSLTSCISGVAQVKADPYVSEKTIYIDIEIYDFKKTLKRDSWAGTMRKLQHDQKTPVNENLTINSRYLQKMNAECFNFVLNKAAEFEENRAIVASIHLLDPKTKNNPPKDIKIPKQEQTLQKIFFGAPGTGKSFRIDDPEKGYGLKNVDESRKFRTTFHPDYDYAQFVGAYKPQKNQVANKALNKNELTAILKEMKDGNNYPIHKFSALYSNSLLKLSNAEQIEIIKEADSPESMAVELKKGIAVGEYLKEKIDGGFITYSFVPQVFAKAYATAWRLYLKGDSRLRGNDINAQVFLVIEEINRGNCAQIFGDIFQLLDRDSDGFSQYSIDADCDFAEWLETEFKAANVWDAYKKEVGGEGKLKLPSNLNILATMNTSDQSLFPMDSAFKRRFDWEYVPISFEGKDAANFQIYIDGSRYSWQKFVETVNQKILNLTDSEDKQLGEFFIKPDNGNDISKNRFLGKVMFYLWNEVCKDEHKNGSFFRTKDDGHFTFQDLYKPEKKDLLKKFLDELLKEGASQD